MDPDRASEPVTYRVGVAARAQHLFDVEARFPAPSPGEGAVLDVRMPVWTPGSYLVREYERHVQELACEDESGAPLPVEKIDKACWRVAAGAARAVVVRYRVYAHEITVRTNHLDDTHGFFNGAATFVYVEALRRRPIRLAVDLPAGWRVATGLRSDGDGGLRAADYDELVDSPVEIGPHERLEFEAAGRPCAIAVWGRAPFDRRRLEADVTAIIEAQAALFGGVPYDDYTFLLHLVPGGYGGLEHKTSSTLLATPAAFLHEKRYGDFLELVSHEFFHLWNGKRIRPAALGPFDYQNENYTRSLWVVEGWTSYYDRLMLRRSKRISAARFREKLGEDLTKLGRTPGRHRQSLLESSFDAWIKLYRPDENSVNTTVSYYLKGSVAAMLLDLEIRRRTGGARSLDDALRLMWEEFRATGAGYADDAVQGLVERAAGVPLDDVFAHAVRGRGDIELDAALALVGLRLRRTGATVGDDARECGWLGANLVTAGERLRVSEALEGSPAQAGHLYAGDEIVAWDGLRVDEAGVKDRLANARPGDTARLHVFRRDELRELTVTLARRPADKIEVVPHPDATAAARAAYARWMGEEWSAA